MRGGQVLDHLADADGAEEQRILRCDGQRVGRRGVAREGRPIRFYSVTGSEISMELTMGFYVLVDTNTWKYVEGRASVSPQSNHLLLGVTHIKKLQSTYSVKFR